MAAFDEFPMKNSNIPRASAPGIPARAPYKAPCVTVFGPVGMLTQGGSGPLGELMDNGMGMISCSMNMNVQDPMC